jgi:hypothetical protein
MNWDYITGFFDGEGNIYTLTRMKKNYVCHSIRLALTQVNREVLDEIADFLNKHGLIIIRSDFYCKKYQPGSNSSDAWYLYIDGYVNCKTLLENMRNGLIVKRDECDKALEFLKLFKTHKFRGFLPTEEIKQLRSQGKSYAELGRKYGCSYSTIMRVCGWREKREGEVEKE